MCCSYGFENKISMNMEAINRLVGFESQCFEADSEGNT